LRYLKPDYYEDFTCVADKCPDTCCAGWQIVIDEDSLEQYGEVPGAFGKRLVNSIDWQEGCFYQYNRRCAFLNKENLCDLYTELGAEALCNTCKNYPRHTEEYEGLRELSLSLSCPIAARMILLQEKFPEFVEYEDDKEEELAEEFEDFDILMFTQLEDARAAVLRHLKETEGSLEVKMDCYLQFAKDMQECIDRGEYFEVDAVVRAFEEAQAKYNAGFVNKKIESESRYMHRKQLYQHIVELERLREEWTEVLEDAEKVLYAQGQTKYDEAVKQFETFLDSNLECRNHYEMVGVQLFVFFLYTYFCGAVYDDRIYSKMALAVESVRFVRELYLARWLEKGTLTKEDYVELAYRYAREIEHSDINLEAMEDFAEFGK